jgi:5'-3' exonuclease
MPGTPPLINDLSRGSVDTREDLALLSSGMQNAVIVLVGIQARLYSLVRENEHVYAWDVTSSSIRHSIFNRYESVACQVAMR